jgi:thioredoxin 1
MAHELTDDNFSKNILESKGITLVDFWAPWCGPCRQLSPIVEELANDMAGKMDVYKCNIDENPETPSKYAVRGIPTLMIFKEGKLIDTKVGALSKAALYEWVKNNL